MCNMSSLALIVTVCSILKCYSYNLRCPEVSQRIFRAGKCLNTVNSNYQCLFSDDELNVKEFCKGEEIAREGFKYVLKPNPQQVDCSPPRYQPFTFTSHELSYCIYEKSDCNEEGQVVTNNGSTTSDRQCRCDYTKGYMFVHSPKSRCSCIPSEEDCSCYHNPCTDENPIMLADYRCVNKGNEPLPESIMCPAITSKIVSSSSEEKTTFEHEIKITREKNGVIAVTAFICIVLVIVAVLVLLLVVFIVISGVKYEVVSGIGFLCECTNSKYTVLQGDSVVIRCSISCLLPIKSVMWKREGNIVSSNYYKFDRTTRTTELTFDNVKELDSGTYSCVVEFCLGLRSTHFVRCSRILSRVPLLTNLCQQLPTFFAKGIQREEHSFSAYIGRNITFEIGDVANQGLKKLVRRGADGNLSEIETQTGNWTISNCRENDTGQYLCISICRKCTKIKYGHILARLNVIEEDDTYRNISAHRNDSLYVRTVGVSDVMEAMRRTKLVLITGRQGSGKTKLCTEIASIYDKKGKRPFEIGENSISEILFDDHNTLYIIDDIKTDKLIYLDKLENHTGPTTHSEGVKLLVNCRRNQLSQFNNINKGKCVFTIVDLDKTVNIEDKRRIFQRYMEEFGESTQITLDDATVDDILNSDPWIGFPSSIDSFFRNSNGIYFPEQLFSNPPKPIALSLKRLYQNARYERISEDVNKLCVLLHIWINENHNLSFDNDFDKYEYKAILSSFSVNEDATPISVESLKHAADSMVGEFLWYDRDNYTFVHPLLSLAILYTNPDIACDILIRHGSLEDIFRFIRQNLFTFVEDGSVYKLEDKFIYPLCERIVIECCRGTVYVSVIGEYIYTWIAKRHTLFKSLLFECIENVRYDQQGQCKSDHSRAAYFGKNNGQNLNKDSKERQFLSTLNTLSLIDGMTNKGRDTWIFEEGVSDYFLLCSILLAVKDDYQSNRKQAFETFLKYFTEKLYLNTFQKAMAFELNDNGDNFISLLKRSENNQSETFKIIMECCSQAKLSLSTLCLD